MKTAPRIRVLIADNDILLSRRLAEYLSEKGFDLRFVSNGRDARKMILDWKPRFVLADLMLPEGNALELIDFVKGEKELRHQFVHILVTSAHNLEANVRQSLDRGAKDYIVKPFRHADVIKRLIFHSRGYRQVGDTIAKDQAHRVDEASFMLHLTDLVLRQALGGANLADTLFNLTRMVSMKVAGVRCSVIHCLDQINGIVVTSNDNRSATGIQLDLYKYPEVLHVLNTRSLVAVENMEASLELKHVLENVKDIAFNSMIVCPVTRHGHPFGVLSLRMPPEKHTVSDNEIRFVEIVAHVISLVLGLEIHKESGDFWRTGVSQTVVTLPAKRAKNS
ncbi:MAG TPA: response regulator [Bdellovibrionales bacterium]|nr:response regulator [Bdellovibrionales bacterium]